MDTNSIVILVFGIICSLLSMAYFVPQVIKAIKEKNTSNISIYFCIFGLLSSLVWIVFGSLIVATIDKFSYDDSLVIGLPIIISNVLLFILQTVLLIFKIKHIKFVKDNKLGNQKEKDKQ